MDETVQDKLENYLDLYDKVRARTGDDRSALAILQEMNKDKRMAQIRAERNGNGDQPATDRQKGYLKKLGVEVPADLTKAQASALIDGALAKESE
jgi:hypothetical protein